jgi:hypothetical protein
MSPAPICPLKMCGRARPVVWLSWPTTRRMSGTDIPVVNPAQLVARPAASVALFVDDLLAEVRSAYPEVEATGGYWVTADTLGPGSSGRLEQHT